MPEKVSKPSDMKLKKQILKCTSLSLKHGMSFKASLFYE